MLEPRQIDISIQYLHRHLNRQAGHREVLFLSAKSTPKWDAPCPQRSRNSRRGALWKGYFFPPPLFLLSFRLPTTPFTVDLFSDDCREKWDIMASNICFVQAVWGTPGQDLYCLAPRRGWGDLRVAGTKALGSLMDRWGRCRSCPCPHLTCKHTEKEREEWFLVGWVSNRAQMAEKGLRSLKLGSDCA